MPQSDETHRQFAFVNNLFIGLSTGILTFLVHLAFNNDFSFSNVVVQGLVLLATITTFASLLVGVILAWIRVQHFRLFSGASISNERGIQKIREAAIPELLDRKLIKAQGLLLLLSALFLFILAFSELLNKGAG